MEPMKPLKPLMPMEPMEAPERWWPENLGEPSTAGSEDDLRYAYFAKASRLAVSRSGQIKVYDAGNHKITGVSQEQSQGEGDVHFSTSDGEVALKSLKVVD